MNNDVNNNTNELSFEEAVAKLESIVSSLETGKCDLDRSLELFEEGVKLVKNCSSKLDEASAKVKLLTSDGEEDFIVTKDGANND